MTNILYPLTTSQNMLQASLREFGTAQVLTIGVCIVIQAPVEFAVLRSCLTKEICRLECLRLHFTAPDEQGRVMQYIIPELRPDIPHQNLKHMEKSKISDLMTEWSTKGFDAPNCPLFRLIMVSLPDGWNGVYLCIDHRIMDSCGLISMMNDVLELYCHDLYHTAMPPMPASYEESLQMDLAREKDAALSEKGAAFWKQQLSLGEPLYTDTTGTWKLEQSRTHHNHPALRSADLGTFSKQSQETYHTSPKQNEEGHHILRPLEGDMAQFCLQPKQAAWLAEYCRVNSVSMTNLLLMGMRTCLSKANGMEPDISLRNYVSRRSSRHNRTSGGCRIHCYPCRTIVEGDTTFLGGIRQIQTLQNGIYRHCNFDPEAVNQMITESFHTPSFTTYEGAAFTCQPLPLTPANPFLRHIPLQIDWFSSKADIQKLYLTVMQKPQKQGLGFYFKYQKAELSEEDIACFFHSLIHGLSIGTSRPDVNVKEVLTAMESPYLSSWEHNKAQIQQGIYL